MASTSDIAKRYFAAIAAHDLDAATACWRPGAVDRLVGAQELVAPDGIRAYFGELFAAFPDFDLEVLELTSARQRTAVRWRARGTFAGPGTFQGFAPNHASVVLEGCDVVTVEDELITHNDAPIDSGDVARQLGLLPGHAPGLIGLFRHSDRLALVSDCVYTLDIQTGRKGGPRIPHAAFDADVEQARASIRQLAALGPEVAWAGHADPVTGDVRDQLERAAEAPV